MISLWVERGYFDDWLFTRCTINEACILPRDVSGVCDVARLGDLPVPVPERVMSVLMGAADNRGVIRVSDETLRSRFCKGDRVVFSDRSPLSGTTASVIRDNGRDHVRVLLDMMGCSRVMTAPVDMLLPVAA